MRLTFVRTSAAAIALLAFYACDSGSNNPLIGGGTGGAATSTPGNNGGTSPSDTSQGQGGGANPVTGGTSSSAATGGTVAAGGTSAQSSTGKGGAATGGAATGGAATGGAACTPSPLPTWKSFAACKATTTAMDTAYASWKSSYYGECSDGTAYAKSKETSGASAVVSEGIGYGMLMAANLGKADDFKKFWATYKKFKNSKGLMSWRLTTSCPLAVSTADSGSVNSAADADVDAAMALIVAAKAGFDANYLAEAKTLISAIKQGETSNCSGKTVLFGGDTGWSCNDLNPSYFAPGYYRVFATVSGDSSWNQMATDALALLLQWQSKRSDGLVPDWGKADGSVGGATKTSAAYGVEACRVPWRVAVDYGWHKTAEAKTFLTKMYEGVLKKDRPFFAIEPSTQNSSSFVGGFSLVGTAIDQATCDLYFTDWYNRSLDGDNTYYALTLRVLYLITAGGRFNSGQ